MPSTTRSVLIALASSIILSSISILLLTYALAFKSQSGLLTSQSLPLVSRLLTLSSASLSPVSCFLPRPYLTIHNLFIRYAPLSKLTNALIIPSFKVLLPKVLLPIILKDFFNRFTPKASATPLNPSLTAKILPAPQLLPQP